MRWLNRSQLPKPIALSITLAAMLLLAAVSYLSAETAGTDMTPEQEQQYNDAKQSAGSLGNEALQHFGTESGIQQNINAPMTSGNAEMETLDGNQSFAAQLTSPSSSKFLTIIVQPGSGGDITSTRIMQDTDMDDEVDYDFMLPFRVSGVCGNGLISCDSGTWSNCRYYKWDVDDNDKLILEEGDLGGRLGGCYCVNNSCGSNLVWNNLQSVLGSLGGGASGAMMNTHPHYVITKVEIDGPSITYYGQNPDNVSQTSSSYGNASPEQFYQGDLDSAAENEAVTQSTDPDSYYTLLSNAFETQDGVEIMTCTVKHDVVVNQETCTEEYVQGDEHWCWAWSGCSGCNCSCIGSITYSGSCNCNDYGCTSVQCVGGDCMGRQGCPGNCSPSEQCPGNTPPAGSIYRGCWQSKTPTEGGGCSASFYEFHSWHDQIVTYTCPVTGSSYPNQVGCQTECQTPRLVANNGCNPDDSCQLRDEKVCDPSGQNCVWTFRNFAPTGLKPLSYCKNITAIGNTYAACMDGCNATIAKNGGSAEVLGSDDTNSMWWWIERTYKCDTDKKFDFTNEKERVESVTSTLQDNTDSLYYRDYRKGEDGSWGYMDTAIALSGRDVSDVCEKACKLRKVKEDTQAGSMGTTAQNRTTILSYEYIYKACTDGTCPVEDGEEIVKSCQCISDFSEAATVMSAVNSASHDLICSDGVKK
ncbi:MAG: hypothetical protein JXB42_11610 [Deltaproteobacteria bacterium]|nr:hypothetical protein [Deltaproteobacteria bacterium]